MPEPMIAMSIDEGSEGVERRFAWGEGWESQYDGVGLGRGRICALLGMLGVDGVEGGWIWLSWWLLLLGMETRRRTISNGGDGKGIEI